MDRDTLIELDYCRIRDNIAQFCASEEAKLALETREPFTDAEHIEKLKNTSRDWQLFNASQRAPVILPWPEVFPVFKIIKTSGAALTVEQAHALLLFCTCAKKITAAITAAAENMTIPHLANTARALPDLTKPYTELSRIITVDGEIKELPELRDIKNRIAALTKKIGTVLHAYTTDKRFADALESNVPVLRANREVLAVKAQQRSKIHGIIHGVSQSGHTVYIEPEEAVSASNERMQEEANLHIAIREILRTLTATLLPFAEQLEAAHPILLYLDQTCATARWGIVHSCSYALTCDEENPLTLLQARHPLLAEKAVPIDVRFMKGKRVLIITGPNAGGKTVTLKTIALFALLNQSGFPIPAQEGSRLPIFNDVFADIGDGQSLDESLSTFSAHMKKIAHAVSACTEKSLVLLDELGSGTDWQEGSAIAMAVLDALIKKNPFVLVTTHHGALKNYGWMHERCINASVEFNSETLTPTYRLIMGVPGESRALDIAEKSGLDAEIIKNARAYIAGGKSDISALINGLHAKHAEADALLQAHEARARLLNEMQRKVDLKNLSLRQREHELNSGVQTEAQRFLHEARSMLENLVRELREGEMTKDKTLAVRSFINSLTESVEAQNANLEKEADALVENAQVSPQNESRVFAAGATVLAAASRRSGTIISASGKNKWLIQFGNIKIEMKEKDLTVVPPSKHKNTPLVTIEKSDGERQEQPAYELRLLGMRETDAIKSLEKQLDLCVLHNVKNFSVIHGKGNGILQQAVRDYLSHYSAVKEFCFAPSEDGGAGKTYVTLW
ncbi:MAG: endonuclease MutS2 [Treponema sp.]|nr:endonuclease MutS2 [Treponema sp.]